ncbi:hypothetical protein DIZ81_05745 [Legionella taurinensis]|uniref:Uncharacterized protein n=2 Tax=Legionella taurinensis TaxID=70611 RepID=A0A3A5LQS6_9GAMM|nr:hypothetical protein DB744_05745 [Legionella taurinensis]PUT44186.1 hypothetical protein DB746_04145 [Legionella taurinensis]PUT47487.1 hypothetical protein DB743_02315 [Legionella taurinensis]PUT48626.1 hypothetical protein DB745_04145 [Legionella taurinensis]RJT47992.1 hypothetical protein D6J04_05340 [Legionella taurinensis]
MRHFSRDSVHIPNPRLLAAVYFALIAIVLTIVVSTVLYALGFDQSMHIVKAIFLGGVVAAFFGALFGRRLLSLRQPCWHKAFLLGFLMALTAIPVYDVGLLYLMKDLPHHAFNEASFEQTMAMYLFVVTESYILGGLGLGLIMGLAAVCLRNKIIYTLLHIESNPQRLRYNRSQRSYKRKLRTHHH